MLCILVALFIRRRVRVDTTVLYCICKAEPDVFDRFQEDHIPPDQEKIREESMGARSRSSQRWVRTPRNQAQAQNKCFFP